jgi:hypothetical protein
MSLRAETISSSLESLLKIRPRRGRVHSCYSRTVNILCDDMTWTCLHPPEVPLHPYSVRIGPYERSHTGGDFLDASRQEAAEISHSMIDLGQGRVRISLEGAGVWDSSLTPLTRAPEAELGDSLVSLDALLEGVDVESPFLDVLTVRNAGESGDGSVSSVMIARAAAVMGKTEDAWKARLLDGTLEAMTHIVGLGFGLTPSGDDFLVGLLGASHFFAYDDNFRKAVFSTMQSLIHRTSLPSFFMLKAALEGRYPEPLAGLLHSLACRDLYQLRRALDCLFSVGAMSGQDLLAGVLFYLRISAICGVAHAAH